MYLDIFSSYQYSNRESFKSLNNERNKILVKPSLEGFSLLNFICQYFDPPLLFETNKKTIYGIEELDISAIFRIYRISFGYLKKTFIDIFKLQYLQSMVLVSTLMIYCRHGKRHETLSINSMSP